MFFDTAGVDLFCREVDNPTHAEGLQSAKLDRSTAAKQLEDSVLTKSVRARKKSA